MIGAMGIRTLVIGASSRKGKPHTALTEWSAVLSQAVVLAVLDITSVSRPFMSLASSAQPSLTQPKGQQQRLVAKS